MACMSAPIMWIEFPASTLLLSSTHSRAGVKPVYVGSLSLYACKMHAIMTLRMNVRYQILLFVERFKSIT